jgi:hypothetical protein
MKEWQSGLTIEAAGRIEANTCGRARSGSGTPVLGLARQAAPPGQENVFAGTRGDKTSDAAATARTL